jgi:hypothetical protein
MAENKRGEKWDVDGSGVAVLVRPAATAESRQVSSKKLDRAIARLGQQKERAATQVATAQARLDAMTAEEAALVALRARVNAEPA